MGSQTNSMETNSMMEEDDSDDSGSHRGINVSKKSKVVEKDALGREIVEPLGDTFVDKSRILKAIHKAIHSHYDGPWRSFSKVPMSVVDMWWSEFEHQFFWKSHHGPVIKRNWRIKCGSHIRNVFNAATRNKKVPPFVRKRHWKKILEEKNSCEKYKRICAINKLNRASKKHNGNSNYAGGSKSTAEYAQEFKEEHGREITQEELMRATYHSKRLGRWTGERPKEAVESYEQKCKDWLETHEELTKEDSFSLWAASVGGERKGRLFGKGSLYYKTDYVLNPPAPSRGASPTVRGRSPPTRGMSPSTRAPPSPLPDSSQPPRLSCQMSYDHGISATETRRAESILQTRYEELKAYEERLRRKEIQMAQNLHPTVSPGFQSLLMNGDSNLFNLTDEPVRRTSYSSGMTSYGSQLNQISDLASVDPFPMYNP